MDQGLNDPLTPRETWDGPSHSWASAPPLLGLSPPPPPPAPGALLLS